MKSRIGPFKISINHNFFLVLVLLCLSNISNAQVPQAESDALVALYNSTGGANWTSNNNWLDGDPCVDSWVGISCFGQSSIVGINLNANNLIGPLPPDLTNITDLETLYLAQNKINGTIPIEYGNFSLLLDLQLQNNQISGSLPPQLASTSTLEILNLSHNRLEGSIPVEFGNFFNLEELYLFSNKLTGNIPFELVDLTPSAQIDKDKQLGSAPLTILELKYNALDSNNSSVNSDLDNLCNCDWRSFQTTIPNNINVIASSLDSMSANWESISYQRFGTYLIYIATDEFGPYTFAYETSSKTETAFTAGNLAPDQSYFFKFRTKTFPSPENSNEVITIESEAIQNFTDKTIGNSEVATRIRLPKIRPNGTATYRIMIENLGPDLVLGANLRHNFSTGFSNGTWQCVESLGGAVCPSTNIVVGNVDLIIDLPINSSLEFNLESDVVSQNQDFIIDNGSFIISTTITPPEDFSDSNLLNNTDTFDLNKIFSSGFDAD